jgi:tRNA 2-thiocytidine biosynthesis protein TtcA
MRTPKPEREVVRKAGRAIGDYGMIDNDDRIMVAVSGGKDSWTLLHVLETLRQKAPVEFSILAANIDPGFDGFRSDLIKDELERLGFEYVSEKADFGKIISEHGTPGKSFSSFCARLRRGILYTLAQKHECSKIALGHHMDDAIETLLLSQLFAGQIKSMPPVLVSDDGKNTVIRPLIYASEDEIESFATATGAPIVSCSCPECGGRDHKRAEVKELIAQLEEKWPGIKANLFASLGNVVDTHLIGRRDEGRVQFEIEDSLSE